MTAPALDAFFASCPAMLFVADAEGTLRHTSRALAERFAHRFEQERTLAALVDDDDDRRALARLLEAIAADDALGEHSCSLRVPEADSPRRLELRCAARRDAEGLIHGQLEIYKATANQARQQFEATLLDTLMETLDIVLWAVDPEGVFVFQQGKALGAAGLEAGQFVGLNIFEIYPPENYKGVSDAFAGEANHTLAEAHGVHWESWNIPIVMEGGIGCAGITLNVTDRVTTKRNLEQQLETIQTQQQAILELSAPVLAIWDKVLAVPLIGLMDKQRTDELTERLLGAAHQSQTRFVILDLTGVEVVDTSIAAHVLRLLGSLELLGIAAMITGVSPQVARTMVSVGVEFEDVMTHRNLREGLRYCMRQIAGL